MASCVAVIGKENSPLYIACITPEQELGFHYSLHTSLDFIEEKLSSTNKGNDHRDLYLGLLYSTEHQRIFGYVTNTKIKFVIIVNVDATNTNLRDNETRQMFRKLHVAYTNVMSNPFYTPSTRINSNKFAAVANSILAKQS
eukprot:TRINITY_DN632_c0_g1_i1.p1 TRINITY_DN632_c0_g1~~TRINITY_DN632_c0_g1_i1.p1  ORF type:complete len:141 (+),score=9.83 TRINITY_DN632_c0_g1_i1:43-465(+)